MAKKAATKPKKAPAKTVAAKGKKQNLSIANKEDLVLPELDFRVLTLTVGGEKLCQNRFPEKAKRQMLDAQTSVGPKKKTKEPRDIDQEYYESQHRGKDEDGTEWNGVPATAFKAAMVEAGTLLGIPMTQLRRTLHVEQDGFDYRDETPLVRLTKGEPRMVKHAVRLQSGVASISIRAMFDNWQAKLRIRYDATCLDHSHVLHLLQRAALQIGVGEGRTSSKKSVGMGWGTFHIVGDEISLEKAEGFSVVAA